MTAALPWTEPAFQPEDQAPSIPAQPTASHTTQQEQLLTLQTPLLLTPKPSALNAAPPPPPQRSLLQETPTLIQMSLPTLPLPLQPLPSATKNQLPQPYLNSSTLSLSEPPLLSATLQFFP